MQVSEVMHKGIVSAQISDSIQRVAALMRERDIGSLPVYNNERPVGFVTDRDIVVSCVANGKASNEPVSSAMTTELVCVTESQDINEAAKLMREKQISRLLVVDEGQQPVGMLSLQDLNLNLEDDQLKADVIEGIKH